MKAYYLCFKIIRLNKKILVTVHTTNYSVNVKNANMFAQCHGIFSFTLSHQTQQHYNV